MSGPKRDPISGKVPLRAHRCPRCTAAVLEEQAVRVKLADATVYLCPTDAEAAKAKAGDTVVVCARGGELIRAKDATPIDVAGEETLHLCAACLELAAGKPKAKPAAKA